jgi:hypothetical protein
MAQLAAAVDGTVADCGNRVGHGAATPRFLVRTTPFGEAQEIASNTRWPHFGVDHWCWGWVWGPAMKYALESVTLVTFAAFLAWSLKILIAWA